MNSTTKPIGSKRQGLESLASGEQLTTDPVIASAPELNSRSESIRTALRAVMERDNLSQSTVSRESGVNAARLNQWLSGKYTGRNDEIDETIERWLESYKRRLEESARLPIAPGCVETPTLSRICGALSYAQMAADITVIYGGAGLGKTMAIEHYQSTSPNVWVATMTPASSGVFPCLQEIADGIGLNDISGGMIQFQRLILRRLRGTAGLLIIDEAQHLSTAALDQIRSIHDLAKVGLALVGNDNVYTRMTGGNRAAYLDRLYSRIGKRTRLTGVLNDDIRMIIKAWGINESESITWIREISKRSGALRSVTKVIRLGAMLSNAAGKPLSLPFLKAAWADLSGDQA